MLRAAATVVAVLAALPAVTPLLGGYRAFSECRNLTHLGPGSWPDMYKKQYNYTGLLVMPGDVCSGSLVAPKYMLSSSLCRLWKLTGNESFQNDVDDNESEVRIGVFQGDISQKFFQSQRVKQYLHWGSNRREVLMNPVMIVETEEEFQGPSHMILPGMLASAPSLTRAPPWHIVVDIVGYEHSVNMPIYHQAIIDAHVYMYKDHCQKYGRKKWELSDEAFCTWDVSPVRTVCQIDRGAPVVFRNLALGITLGFVDDMTHPSSTNSYCGQGRIHYNVFLMLRKYGSWIKEKTGGRAKLMRLVDGRAVEEDSEDGGATEAARPGRPSIGLRRHFPDRIPHRDRDRSGSGRQGASTSSLLPLLLAAAASAPRCVCKT